MRLVIDTNIIVSALLSEDSKAFHLLSDVLDENDRNQNVIKAAGNRTFRRQNSQNVWFLTLKEGSHFYAKNNIFLR